MLVFFISLLLAFLASLFPLPNWANLFCPPWVLLTLLYWSINLPARVLLILAWLLGLLFDELNGQLLGHCALTMSFIIYLSSRFYLYINRLSLIQQAFLISLLVLLFQSLLFLGQNPNQRIDFFYCLLAPPLVSWFVWPCLTSVLHFFYKKRYWKRYY